MFNQVQFNGTLLKKINFRNPASFRSPTLVVQFKANVNSEKSNTLCFTYWIPLEEVWSGEYFNSIEQNARKIFLKYKIVLVWKKAM